MGRKNVFLMGDTAFLPGAKAAVVMTEDVGFLEDKKFTATVITPAKGSSVKKEVRFVPFGHQDKLPVRIMKKIADNTIVGSNIEFKANMAYGDGLMVCRRVKNPETQKIELEELTPEEAPEIFQFISDSNYLRVMSELANDLVVFSDSFVYLAFGKRKAGERPKVVQIWHREMCFSRISEQDEKTKRIEYHGYSSQWGEESFPDDVIVTRLLDPPKPCFTISRSVPGSYPIRRPERKRTRKRMAIR